MSCIMFASHSKATLGWLAKETQTAPDMHLQAGQRRAALAWKQSEFLTALDEAPRYLDDVSIQRIDTAGHDFLDIYVSLCEESSTAGDRRWKLLRKVHPLLHLLEDMCTGDRLNAKFFCGWSDETLMGKVIGMVEDHDSRQAIWNVLSAYWPMYVERSEPP